MSGPTPLAQSVNATLLKLADELNTNKLQLPSPPNNLLQLRKLIQEQANINDIVGLLSRDPHLSARIIKIANSALFSSRLPVSSVKSAVIRLGSQKVSNLITGLAITQSFITSQTRGIQNTLEHYWENSVQVAAIASVLAKSLTRLDADEALLAGLIHNIGAPPLLFYLNKLSELNDAPELKIKVIHLVLSKRSAQVGKAILKKWQFPETMQAIPVVANSDEVTKTDTITTPGLIHLSLMLKDMNWQRSLQALAPEVLAHPAFPFLWESEAHAIEQLNDLAEDILQTRQLLSST